MENKQHAGKKKQWVINEIKEEIRKNLETNNNKNNFTNSMGYSKSRSKREVHSDIDLPQETRKISNKQINLLPKRIRKRRPNKSKVSRRKEIIKIREELNRDKKTIEKFKKNQELVL